MGTRPEQLIRIEGARQNNLQGVTVRVPVGAVTAVTGVAGAGKSSLAFDVLYAEGYRRYVETFSPYARQFLERLDRPRADRIDGVLPANAIDRTAPVRTSRSTVGTMSSIADYLRALYARAATLHCRGCGAPVERDSPSSIVEAISRDAAGHAVLLCFAVRAGQVRPAALRDAVGQAGFRRVLEEGRAVPLEAARLEPRDGAIRVVVDRVEPGRTPRARLVDSIETALLAGKGRVEAHVEGRGEPMRFSEALHCARCDLAYSDPTPAIFSFNNPVGACETCKGFGRTMDIDPDLVVPDPRKSIAEGCIRPFQGDFYSECQRDLLRLLRRRGLRADVPWSELPAEVRRLVWEGEPGGREEWRTRWYGIEGLFEWLESRTYRMHVRVFLSRYRRYLPCPDCRGTRLKPGAGLFRIAGRTLPDVEALPISEAERAFREWTPPRGDVPAALLLREVRARLAYLCDVGLGYLALARQSRTLSGGEAQRVTLATALGSSLTSTLYVLDEPSVGLHARDVARLAGVLRRLAAAGNAVVVVEHDPALVSAADHVIDLGPGPGREGGKVVYEGPLPGLLRAPGSRTGAWLAGRLRMPAPPERRVPGGRALRVVRARENNLHDLTVEIPLGLLVCVTGVSGSGKSTLVDQVLYRNLRRGLGLSEPEPGACDGVLGVEHVAGAVLVDQSPLGRSSRVNAATYIGALAPIREAFAATDAARERGLGAAAFSFNSAAGACPACEGAGYEKVELQFLPDAYVRCPACDGRRYRPEVLEIRCRGHTVVELLDLPAKDVARVFADDARVVRALRPLLDIGLGYLSLSQAAPTLSGGEAQRLKLAAHLARGEEERNLVFVLDEPTTGLHASDVSVLLAALHRLVTLGHSVVVVEHDVEVALSADWIVDLGPEGGDAGGTLVGEGPAERVAELDTPTGRMLRGALARTRGGAARRARGERTAARRPERGGRARLDRPDGGEILVQGAREHNLAGVEVRIPREALVAVTGVSGSGKSTLAFDVLYAEGQRRFLDCLPTYARQFIRPLARPDVDRIERVPPTVALEQKLSRGSPLSTVGTASEAYHYLRLLFAFLGVPHCPRCGIAAEVASPATIAGRIARDLAGEDVLVLAPVVRKRKGAHRAVFAALHRRGVAGVRVDGVLLDVAHPPRLDRWQLHDVEAVVERVPPGPGRLGRIRSAVTRALEAGGGTLVAAARGRPDALYSSRRACPGCGAGLPVPDPRLFTFTQRFGACAACEGLGIDPSRWERVPCRACGGTRLRAEALAVRIGGESIGDVARRTVREARAWISALRRRGGLREEGLARHGTSDEGDGSAASVVLERVLPDLAQRLALVDELGVGYLTLDRGMDTLATGEAQRIRIAAALASNLRGVCYVLDEPTVGLHPRDTEALTRALAALRDRANTVVVVEHDEAVVRAADHVIDLGPGAGPHGGRVIAAGTPGAVARAAGSVTGLWLRGGGGRPAWPRRPLAGAARLRITGARLHNLRGVDVEIPLGRLVCVTGPSGSGKSTLVRDVLHPALVARAAGAAPPPVLDGLVVPGPVARALVVDESPIGRTPRSVPATYVGVMDPIRRIFAETPEARVRGYGAGRFSFNVAGGRCERCEGQGRLRVTMPLLPEVYVACEACGARRYNADTVAVSLRGKSIADVLAMTVDEARELFASFPGVRWPLEFVSEIGLGYLRLGQPSPTLSGGEAQRIKIAAELVGARGGHCVYLLDEPTTGLHMADVARLIAALHRLVERGHTVVVIEHNLDLVAASDCVVDLGPEGGDAGGRVVAWGTPEEVAGSRTSRTAPYLRPFLQRAARRAAPAAAAR
ncbi:excinuclease ABC subunit UvrA [Anaeromyxobacter oryzisoli]|uniref:excinuclease ABC subunit UvrA n=1 Tax=Anaeromyxobacter oryzisoli TaxID=2925408 RepID=UPI001F56331A|nr:excinuclease ABC subunit UvrA [Anaeromyxobacter sp. SG63]